MAEALLALGANVGDVRATLEHAVEMICDGDLVRLRARSSDYRTPPWGVEQQPEFVNLCIAVETNLSPGGLLERVQQIEATLGRDRAGETRWGPRPIDLDVLVWGARIVRAPELEVPHPRLAERRFALLPLIDLVGEGFVVPGAGPAGELARRVADQRCDEVAATW